MPGAGRTLLAGLFALSAGLAACGGGDGNGGLTDPPPSGDIPPRVTLSLGFGQQTVLTDTGQVRSFKLTAADGPREYAVAVQLGSTVLGAASVRMTVKGPQVRGSGSVSAALLPARELPARVWLPWEGGYAHELQLKENMRRELLRVGAVPVRSPVAPSGGTPGPSLSVAGASGPPEAGEILRFFNSVQSNLTVSCSDTTSVVEAVVRKVGQGFVLAEDLDLRGGFTQADYTDLNAELDGVVFPLNTSYWGTPGDIDGNERVIVLFTKAVNELTPPGSGTFIAGFFNPIDLAASGRPGGGGFQQPGSGPCPASNEAEILYILAPDPTGAFGNRFSVADAKQNARGVVAHEFQHLLTAQQRITKGSGNFNSLEETWLSEGFAHLAEEVAGLALAGLATRDDLTLSRMAPDEFTEGVFRAFQLPNLARLRRYLLDPGATQALATTDPPGLPSLAMRGFAWLFLRWLGDHEGPAGPQGLLPGSGEQALFLELSRGGPTHAKGVANVELAVQAVTGRSARWRELLADFALAPALDNGGPGPRTGEGLPPRTQLRTWNLPDVYGDLNAGRTIQVSGFPEPFPLQIRRVVMSPSTNEEIQFSLNASTQRIFVFESFEPPPEIFVEIRSPSGASLPGSLQPQVTIVRTSP